MNSFEVLTKLSYDDRQAIVSDIVAAIKPLLESRQELVDGQTMCRKIGISESTLNRLQRDGLIPSVKIGSRRLFRPPAVIAALELSTKAKMEVDDE